MNIRQKGSVVLCGIKNRCYNENDPQYKFYGAKGVRICDEWLKKGVFLDWYEENYYDIGERLALDKDIVGDGTLYSPEKCILVPFRINGLFVHKKSETRGVLRKPSGMYEVKVRNVLTGENEYKGSYADLDFAKQVYRVEKVKMIRKVLATYKGKLPKDVYDKIYNCKIEG